MTGKALIVARNLREAHDYAQNVLGQGRGRYTVVTTVGTIRAVFAGTVYLLPGWEKRHDAHAIRSALRFTRLEVVDVTAELELLGGVPQRVALGVDQTPDDVADFFTNVLDPDLSALLEDADGAPVEEEAQVGAEDIIIEQSDAPTVEPSAEEPKKGRRRSRCKDCGSLHFKGEPCLEAE